MKDIIVITERTRKVRKVKYIICIILLLFCLQYTVAQNNSLIHIESNSCINFWIPEKWEMIEEGALLDGAKLAIKPIFPIIGAKSDIVFRLDHGRLGGQDPKLAYEQFLFDRKEKLAKSFDSFFLLDVEVAKLDNYEAYTWEFTGSQTGFGLFNSKEYFIFQGGNIYYFMFLANSKDYEQHIDVFTELAKKIRIDPQPN